MSLQPAAKLILAGTIGPELLAFNGSTGFSADTDYTFLATDNQNTKTFNNGAPINVIIPNAAHLPGKKFSFDWCQLSEDAETLTFVLEDAVNDVLVFRSPTGALTPVSAGKGASGTVRLVGAITISGVIHRTWLVSGGIA